MATSEVKLNLNAEGNLDVRVGAKKIGVVKVRGPRK